MSIKKPFKDAVRTQFEKHLNGNLTLYTEGKMPASEQRVVLTRWVGNAWDHICSNTEMVKRSFKKCGIHVNIDGSENALVHFKGISEYVMQMKNSTWTLPLMRMTHQMRKILN